MSHNTWIHRGVRHLVRPLVATPVTPNHITFCRLAGGLVAAGALALGTDEGRFWGAILFCVSFVLDRADGELARQSGKTSPIGHIFDLWSDTVCNALFFVGLGVGLRNDGPEWAVLMGIVAGASVALILWMVLRVESHVGRRGAEIRSVGGFDPDDAILLAPFAIFLGWAEGLLWAAALVTPVFTLLFFWMFREPLRSRNG